MNIQGFLDAIFVRTRPHEGLWSYSDRILQAPSKKNRLHEVHPLWNHELFMGKRNHLFERIQEMGIEWQDMRGQPGPPTLASASRPEPTLASGATPKPLAPASPKFSHRDTIMQGPESPLRDNTPPVTEPQSRKEPPPVVNVVGQEEEEEDDDVVFLERRTVQSGKTVRRSIPRTPKAKGNVGAANRFR